MKILKYILSFLFIVWFGSGIIYEINPRWFMSETATEIPENPNRVVGRIARFLRMADLAIFLFSDSASQQNKETLNKYQDKFLTSDKDYFVISSQLDSLKREAKYFYNNEKARNTRIHTTYLISEQGLIEVSANHNFQAGKQYLYAEYAYLNNRPFSARINGGIRKGNEVLSTGEYFVIWQPNGSVFRKLSKGKIGVAEYEQCAACYQMAQSYLANYAEVQETERSVQEFQQKSNRIASDRRDAVFYKDLPELMPKEMRSNSLVVGYDSNKKPQKIYLSFDNGKRRHSFAYYLENGNIFFAQSSTVALKTDGMTADAKTYHTVQKWYIANGKVIRKEENDQMLPDFPLSHQKIAEDIRLSTEVATKRAK